LVAATAPLLPCVEAVWAMLSADASRVLRALSTLEGELELSPERERWLLDGALAATTGNGFCWSGEARHWLRTPLILEGKVVGVIALFAAPGDAYAASDLARAQALAEIILLVGRSGEADQMFGAGTGQAILDPSEEVLRELANVLDVRSVFARISSIVAPVLAHDKLTMTFHDADGYVGLQVSSMPDARDVMRVRVAREVLARPFVLFPDLSAEGLAGFEPPEARQALIGSGYGSFLAINLTAGRQRMGVEFWSHQKKAFTVADVPLARHVASCIALAVSHEQLIEARPHTGGDAARNIEERVRTLVGDLESPSKRGKRIVGKSQRWLNVLHDASKVAETDATVLLVGESGTGKELIARLIHEVSARRTRPFIGVNCAALPEQLLESELFGFERGAFTGASHAKPGQIELAQGGVLFLDEVSEMSMSAQAKFLRVLQEREFRRLGGTRLLKADVRVIAASNTDLQRAIQNGQFRRDLYYRLRVFDVKLPPLRERREDITALTDALVDEIAVLLHRPRLRLTAAARAALGSYSWPGNVRELRNVLERAVIVCDGDVLDCAHLSFDGEWLDASSSTDVHLLERKTIEKVLQECGGNKSAAAKRLGLSRMQLYVRLRRYQSSAVN
jgi:transcriptional regulator with GAF, ATPase, and Fis domain